MNPKGYLVSMWPPGYLSVHLAEAIRGGHGLGNKSWRPKTSGAEVHRGNNNNAARQRGEELT